MWRGSLRGEEEYDCRHSLGNPMTVRRPPPSSDPGDRTAWQRFLPSGPFALLPVRGGFHNIVWSTTPEAARDLEGLSPEAFADAANRVGSGSVYVRVYGLCLGGGYGDTMVEAVAEAHSNDVSPSILGTPLLPVRLFGICYPGITPRAGAWRPSARR